MSWKKKTALGLLAGVLLFAFVNHRWVAYVAHLARHQLQVVFFKEKIAGRLKRGDLPAAERAALETTLRIRSVAEQLYGISGSKSYQSYFDLGRKELGFNITVAPALSTKPESFKFWPIGSFDYLGFFDEARARSWADRYRAQGFDVHVAAIGGYSTLGWFEDPLYSSQLAWGETGLARLLSHEIAHERLYFNDDTDFSEQLASFIERKAARDYLLAAGKKIDSSEKIAERRKRGREYTELLLGLRAKLEELYASQRSNAEKLRAKTELIAAARTKIEKRRDYFELAEMPEINNAALAQLHRYTPQGQAFENLYAACRKNEPQKTYACWFRELEKLKLCSNAQRKDWLAGDGSITSATCAKK